MNDGTRNSRSRTLLAIALVACIAAHGCAYPSAGDDPLDDGSALGGPSEGGPDPDLERLHETFAQVEVDELLADDKIRNGITIDADNGVGNAVVLIAGANGGVCSAQVINRWFLLTAAHCVELILPEGSGDLLVASVNRAGALGIRYLGAVSASMQPNWRHNDMDTGLVFLPDAMDSCHGTFAECAQSLPDAPMNGVFQFFPAGPLAVSSQYLAVGYGTTDNVNGAGTLRMGAMNRVASSFTLNNDGFVTAMAWTQDGQARPCGADSGSPLVTLSTARVLHTGIASRIANAESTCIPSSGLVAYSGLSGAQLLWVAIEMTRHVNENALEFACVTAADPATNLNVLHCDNDGTLH